MLFELGVKSLDQIQPIYELIEKYKITDISLPDKPLWLSNLKLAETLLSKNSELQITLNFAIMHHYSRKVDFYGLFDDYVASANKIGINKFLVISGSEKKKIDSVELFSKITDKYQDNQFYCAYNPYLSGSDLELENQRLIQKLDTGAISGIYLQIGTDISKLQAGLDFIYSLNPSVQVFSCLMIPNATVLNSLRFRPWKGVYLDNQFISDIDFATQRTLEILQMYRKSGVIPLVEIMPFTDKNINEFKLNYADL